jgi:hypothetical protein
MPLQRSQRNLTKSLAVVPGADHEEREQVSDESAAAGVGAADAIAPNRGKKSLLFPLRQPKRQLMILNQGRNLNSKKDTGQRTTRKKALKSALR